MQNQLTEVATSELQRHVERLHDCAATCSAAVEVHDRFGSETLWHGVVHVFDLTYHPTADLCYAWSSPVAGSRKRRFYAVLHTEQVDSPAKAVRAAIVKDFKRESQNPSGMGFVDGRHYSAYVVEVRRLKRVGDLDGAKELLLRLVDASEAEAEGGGWGVDPWYCEQLAIIYQKKKQPADELAILERYERQAKAPGMVSERLARRLAELRAKARKSE